MIQWVELVVFTVLFGVVSVMGFLASRWRRAETLEHLDVMLPAILRARGPVFVDLVVEPGERYPEDFDYMHGQARERFRARLSQ